MPGIHLELGPQWLRNTWERRRRTSTWYLCWTRWTWCQLGSLKDGWRFSLRRWVCNSIHCLWTSYVHVNTWLISNGLGAYYCIPREPEPPIWERSPYQPIQATGQGIFFTDFYSTSLLGHPSFSLFDVFNDCGVQVHTAAKQISVGFIGYPNTGLHFLSLIIS